MPTYKAQAGFAITVLVDDKNGNFVDLGRFKTFAGGDVTADAFKVRPPGGKEKAYSNPNKTKSDITVTRKASLEDDIAQLPFLRSRVGVGNAKVIVKALDDNGAPWGSPETHTGKLTSVSSPDTDTDAGNDAAMLSLTIGADEETA